MHEGNPPFWAIENDNTELHVTIISVEADVDTDYAEFSGKGEDFDEATAPLLHMDPVTKKGVASKYPVPKLADVSVGQGVNKTRVGIGKYRVHFRFHKTE